jgi:prevent-host-death family protein
MSIKQPSTQTMKISAVRAELNTLVNRVYRKETRVVVEKSGIPVAALVSTDDLERLAQLDRERAERFAVIDEVRANYKGVPDEEIERETDRILSNIEREEGNESGSARSR